VADQIDTGGFLAPSYLTPGSGRFLVRASDGYTLQFLTPADHIDRSGGVGGWQTLTRANIPEAHWYGAPSNDALELTGLLDALEQPSYTVEQRLARLYTFGNPSGDKDPPSLRLYGDVLPRDSVITWKLDELRVSGVLWRPDDPETMWRAGVVLSLSRLRRVPEIAAVRVKPTRGASGKRRQRVLRSRQGDTLRLVGVRELGSASGWKQIRSWNKALRRTDPDVRLRRGTRIVLK
jgi:hypothetical protein